MKYLFVILTFAFVTCKLPNGSTNNLLIQNSSSNVLTDVKIEYSNGSQINIGKLNPSAEYIIKLVDSVNETAVNLIYMDEKKLTHKILVIPYLLLAEKKSYNYKIK